MKFKKDPAWVADHLDKLIAAIEADGFAALVDRKCSTSNSVYLWIHMWHEASGSWRPTAMSMRVSDHPPAKPYAGTSVHPGGPEPGPAWGRVRRAIAERLNQARSKSKQARQRCDYYKRRSRT